MLEQPKEITCKCGKPMKLRKGKFGEFWGCSTYPDCKETMNLKEAGFYHMDDEFNSDNFNYDYIDITFGEDY